MRRGNHQAWAALLSMLLLGGVGDALASSTSPTEASERAPSPPLLERADEGISVATLRSRHLQRWLREARMAKNRPRARCLDRKLSQAHALERRARDEREALVHALSQGDERGAALAAGRLGRFVAYGKHIAEEARACGHARRVARRLPTSTQVKVFRPPLPRPDGIAASSQAAASR